MKKGSSRKLIKSGAAKRLLDDFLELESYVRSNTAHGIYELDGGVPETIISRETSDISQFFEFVCLNGLCFETKWHHILMTISN